MLVDNFTITTVGYKIVFDDPDHDSQAADVRVLQAPARLDTVTVIPTCEDNRVVFQFTKPIKCDDIDAFTFAVTNDNFPNVNFTIDTIYGNDCGRRSDTSSSSTVITMRFSPLIVDSTYIIRLNHPVHDICQNYITNDSVRFRVRPYVRLESFVSGNHQDSVCCNTELLLKATPDENLHGRLSDFRFKFYREDGGFSTPLPGGGYNAVGVYGDSITTTQCFPFRQSLRYKVVATNPRFQCRDSAYTTVRFNPQPTLDVITPPSLCYGESGLVQVVAPSDSSKYTYSWSSKAVPTAKIPRHGSFTVYASDKDSSTANGDFVQRGQNDVLTLTTLAFKPELGRCAYRGPGIKVPLYIGSHMTSRVLFETIERPGKDGNFVLPDKIFLDSSTSFSTDPLRNMNVTEEFVFSSASKEIARFMIKGQHYDTIRVPFTQEGQVLRRLALRDTLPGKVCEVSSDATFEVVLPVVQNLLTRNSDNTNDYFEIPGLPMSSGYQLTVFNRWGRQVFKMDNYDNSFKGGDYEPGTYFYNLVPKTGPGPSYKGWLEISDQQ